MNFKIKFSFKWMVIVAIVLFLLKAGGVEMSWWLVFSPIWIPFAICIIAGLIFIILAGRN